MAQGDSSTFSITSLTIEWLPPIDDGCDAIIDYTIQEWDGSSWNDAQTVSGVLEGTVTGLTAGSLVSLRVYASNSIGDGTSSDSIALTPAILPSAPQTISVSSYGADTLTL